MNTRKLTLVLGVALVTTSGVLSLFSGCSSTNSGNPAPSQHDGGEAGKDGTSPVETGTDSEAGNNAESGAETSLPDTGSCKSDSSSCNTCYTDAEAHTDPLNACSSYTNNCVPVTLTVPTHPAIP